MKGSSNVRMEEGNGSSMDGLREDHRKETLQAAGQQKDGYG